MKPLFSPEARWVAIAGKIAYGTLFCVLLPVLLYVWAVCLDGFMPGLPPVGNGLMAIILGLAGVLLMAAGMLRLWKDGEGLPMNAFPPLRLVRSGVYRWLPHPIYSGSVLALAGAFVGGGLAAGIWIVMPCFIVAVLALLYGYEIPDLKRRFGPAYRPSSLTFPQDSGAATTIGQRCPFGYYGGLLGCAAAAAVLLSGRADFWLLAAAFACAAPLVQAVGRLRCLVQGCCHGRPCTAEHGIRYRQPESRVVRIAAWRDVPLYPTPLYSIAGNLFLLAVLYALTVHRAPSALIVGLYLFLSACLRFVEEAFRGEPQTPGFARLSVYQWLAAGCMLTGVGISMFSSPAFGGNFIWRGEMLLPSLLLGVLAWAAMGVDVPGSRRPLSRLT